MTGLILATLIMASPPQPHLHRLELVAERFDSINPASYDMDRWGSTPNADDPDFIGDAVCHATALFHAEGFTLAAVPYKPGCFEVAYKNLRGHEAVKAFFGMTSVEVGYVFDSRYVDSRDPRAISERIRRYCAGVCKGNRDWRE